METIEDLIIYAYFENAKNDWLIRDFLIQNDPRAQKLLISSLLSRL